MTPTRPTKRRATRVTQPPPDVKLTPEVRAHLKWLENERGQLTPDIVVADARSERSPLHDWFEWDDTIAAEKHRLNQARRLLSSVRVVYQTESVIVSTVGYVRDPTVSARDQGYVSLEQLQRDPSAARQSMLIEFGRAESALKRARDLSLVLHLEDEVEALIARLIGVRHVIDGEGVEPSDARPS